MTRLLSAVSRFPKSLVFMGYCPCASSGVLARSSGATWWLTNLFGALTGAFLKAARATRRIEPWPLARPGASSDPPVGAKGNGGKEGPGEPEEAVDFGPPMGSTEVGHVLHETFPFALARQYESIFVASRGYHTVAQARAMTPERFLEVCGQAGMPRADALLLREEFAPIDHEGRLRFPLFALF